MQPGSRLSIRVGDLRVSESYGQQMQNLEPHEEEAAGVQQVAGVELGGMPVERARELGSEAQPEEHTRQCSEPVPASQIAEVGAGMAFIEALTSRFQDKCGELNSLRRGWIGS